VPTPSSSIEGYRGTHGGSDRHGRAPLGQPAGQAHGRRVRPARPEWIVQLGIGTGRPLVQVHGGDCYAAGNRHRAIDRDEARRLLASELPACPHCQPDIDLRILD
jgi:hypothetical protein